MHRSPSLSLTNRVVDLDGIKYRVIAQLDSGSYADVYKVQRLSDNTFFAIKKIRLLRGNTDAHAHLKNECYAGSKLGKHPYIVQLFDKSEHALTGGNPGDREVFLLYELCPGGNLFKLIQSRTNLGQKGLPENEVILIASHIVQGLVHLHMQQPPIAHRDIKPENVLLGVDNNWKLCDFGSSTTVTYSQITSEVSYLSKSLANGACVQNRWGIEDEIKRQTTRIYQAPEQIDLYSGFPINEKVDIFALGCLIYTLLFFRSPFDPDLTLEHSNARYKIPQNTAISPGMHSLLSKTLTQDPRQRISSTELWSQLDYLIQMSISQPQKTLRMPDQDESISFDRRPHNRTQTVSTNMAAFMDIGIDLSAPLVDINKASNTERANREESLRIGKRSSSSLIQEPARQQHFVRSDAAMLHNYSQSLLQPSQQMPLHPQVAAQQQNSFFGSLQYPTPHEQTDINIRNWVNHYCEVTKNAPSELAFRNLVTTLTPKLEYTRTFMVSINQLDLNMVIVALKGAILIHRQMLYCPKINPLPYEKLFRREHQKWKEIEMMSQGHIGDFYRTPLLTKLLCSYLDLLQEKVQLFKEYGTIVNTAYVLQPGTIGVNNKTQNSPIATQFLVKATRLWDKFSSIHSSLFNERNQLFEIRLSLAINLIEDQFLLMSLLTHLNFTFKVMYNIKKAQNQNVANMGKVAEIINQFDTVFTRCLVNYEALISDARKINDIANVRVALPTVNVYMASSLTQRAEEEARRLNHSQNAFAELLQVHNKVEGLLLPVYFELYPNYLTSCNYDQDVILGNPRYRTTLDIKLPNDYFDDPRVDKGGYKKATTSVPLMHQQKQMQQPQMQQPQMTMGLTQPVFVGLPQLSASLPLKQVPLQQQQSLLEQNFPLQNVQQQSKSFQPALQKPLNSEPILLALMDTNQVQKLQNQLNQVSTSQTNLAYQSNSRNSDQQADQFIQQLKNRKSSTPGFSPIASRIPKATPVGGAAQRKIIKLKKATSPNQDSLPPTAAKVNNALTKQGGILTGDLLGINSQPKSLRDSLHEVFDQQAAQQKVSQTDRVAVNNAADLDTIRRESVTLIDIKKKGQDVGTDEKQQYSEECPPDMYTHPISERNFQYSASDSKVLNKMKKDQEIEILSPIMVNDREKYQGNPLADLKDEKDAQRLRLNRADSDSIVLNDDMEALFDKQIGRRITQNSDLDLVMQMNQVDIEYERMMMLHEKEEVRMSLNLERLKIEVQNKAEIEAKQKELDLLMQRHKSDQDTLNQLRAKLQEKVQQEALFEEQKKKAREIMLKQQQENFALQEQNKRLVEQYNLLQRSTSEQLSNQNQPAQQLSQRIAISPRGNPGQMTQTQQASDILHEQFQKNQDHFRINIDDIRFERQIGAGASADVFKATYKENDVAVKKLKFANNGQDTGKNNLTKEFKREIATLIKVRHTNLVNFMGACTDQNRGHVLILTEFCFGGTLFSLLHEKKTVELTMKQRFRMALDVAKGMNFLHIQEPQILHRDLKSLNLLLVENVNSSTDYVQVKVTDFGLSRSIQEINTHAPSAGEARMTGLAGTFHWMAPEVLQSDTNYSHKADVYSFGIVMWEIMAREPPFKSLRPHEIMSTVVSQQMRPDLNKIPGNCPPQYRAVLEKCWDQNPMNRPDFNIIVKMLKQIETLFV